jgi:glyoxylase-like metal-dependent hydrolase (beta-lactamase superfamily II)
MSIYRLSLFAAMSVAAAASLLAHPRPATTPGCVGLAPAACVTQSLTAMGGRQRLEDIHSVRLDVVSHTLLMEQSYRQAPFITSYARDKTTLDLAGLRLRIETHSIWPESDLNEAESDSTLIATPTAGVRRGAQGDSPCSLADLDRTRERLALGPLRALLTALASPDLRYAPAEVLRETEHTVVAFTWNGVPVRLVFNPFNHLPDAVETSAHFNDFWYHWGEVKQRVYWDNWRYVQGVSYPSNEIIERNGAIWRSSQALDVTFNVALAGPDFDMDATAAQRSAAAKGWERPFDAGKNVQLAAGIDLYRGSWNTTLVHQSDGVVILETPVSANFTRGIFEEAARKYPGEKITAVLLTSDSWPHVGGIRFDVGAGLPIYALDLNLPLLERLLAASPAAAGGEEHDRPRPANWRVVAKKEVVGSGANRMELYPLRGASTERQYMVYFPEHRLLYASDTLVMNENHTLYDPQLMHEVRQAVEREHLAVDTVYAMHEGPTPWRDVIALLDTNACITDCTHASG